MQIIKYKWYDFEPFFILNNNGLFKMKLFMQDINIKIGKKFCIGFFKDGKYNQCPESREIEYGHHCNECMINDDFFQCIQCDGTICINEKRRNECITNNYFIYLAAFDNILKVGISYEHRIIERLIEQGADFGAKIAFVKDGKNVRIIEQQIKKTLSISDRVRGEEKQAVLFGNPNRSAMAISNAIKKLRNNGMEYLIRPEIYDLRKYYHLENVFSKPKEIKINDDIDISGKVVASKGNILVLMSDDKFYSINAHNLIGRDILDMNSIAVAI
ncbi:MAG: DUF2797 domain-containing protein [Candidatus Aenigmatarchaeota archaeon]